MIKSKTEGGKGMENRPFSEVRSNQIPKEIVENLERLGFECRGKYGSF